MKVVIAGGSGLVGSRLTNYLISKGYEINILSRNKFRHLNAAVYEWNPTKNYIEKGALDGVTAVVNLAGAGVADKSWTEERKQLLLDSRVHSAECLFHNLESLVKKPKVVINASAIGYYGYGSASQLFSEQDSSGSDFLADVCVQWERAADRFTALNIRLVKMRIGVVLDAKGGVLRKMKKPIQMMVGAPLGDGEQMISWIHGEDICRMIEFAIEKEDARGAYNAVSNPPVSNSEFTTTLANVLKRPLILPNVPAFAMRLMLGEMSEIVLKGSSVSNEKIKSLGFDFKHTNLKNALIDLL
ncbi:TIGR01777 family oxidoreductase [Reichenbachiella versicolor]|uniref:TIGR01777 family oxidoreductase n=1 Tax=Reichenbachiella versicolor TaxID=1821036 RepID=UPI000D6E0440|nr:TIGR01777 family oxidoreductase [Reichenbachiella versicolor]